MGQDPPSQLGGEAGGAAAAGTQQQAAGGATGAPDQQEDSSWGPDENGPSARWTYNRHTVRLLHICVDLKEDFLKRDSLHTSRATLDGADRNKFWHDAQEKFVDKEYNPKLAQFPGADLHAQVLQ